MNHTRIASVLRLLADAIEEPSTDAQMPADESGEILTTEAASKLLKLSPKEVVRQVKEKGLPGRKIGREWRFRRSEVVAWVSAQKSG